VQEKEAFYEKSKQQTALKKAEQAKAILGQHYASLRAGNRVPASRRSGHQSARLTSITTSTSTSEEEETPEEKVRRNSLTFLKMSPYEKLSNAEQAQLELERLLDEERQHKAREREQESQRAALVKDRITQQYGSLGSNSRRVSYKEMRRARSSLDNKPSKPSIIPVEFISSLPNPSVLPLPIDKAEVNP